MGGSLFSAKFSSSSSREIRKKIRYFSSASLRWVLYFHSNFLLLPGKKIVKKNSSSPSLKGWGFIFSAKFSSSSCQKIRKNKENICLLFFFQKKKKKKKKKS